MSAPKIPLFAAVAFLLIRGAALAAEPLVFIETVKVSEPGNPPDVADPDFPGDSGGEAATEGRGAVDYIYHIGKYEITLDQYTAFLNAVATNSENLWDPRLGSNLPSDADTAGISRSGSAPNYSYSVIGSGDRPVTRVSRLDAARFCNWLHNGATNGADTESGAYQLDGSGAQEQPKWRLPTEDEWYKAAYHRGGGSYSKYAYGDAYSAGAANALITQTNITTTTNDLGEVITSTNTVNICFVTQKPKRESRGVNLLTPVGFFGPSRWGTHDQSGNVTEIFESPRGVEGAGLRGGYYDETEDYMRKTQVDYSLGPDSRNSEWGFRVVALQPMTNPQDRDGDGLLDEWETEGKGIDVNNDGTIDLDLHALGARPDRKDLFVEVDTEPFLQAAWSSPAQWPPFQLVIDAFAKAPVANPNGTQGITLHIERSDATVPPEPNVVSDWPSVFDQNKALLFGSASQRTDSNSASILAAKAQAFRYCIIYGNLQFADNDGDGQPDAFMGKGETPGDDFWLNLPSPGLFFDGKRDTQEAAALFMHELGHTLGLGHGGSDDMNGKPNYPSIMNYALTLPRDWNKSFWKLDFSREGDEGGSLFALDELELFEFEGINSKLYKKYLMPVGVPVGNTLPETPARKYLLIRLDGRPFDYNNSGRVENTPVAADLNFVGSAADFSGVDTPSHPQIFRPHNDWANLTYAVTAVGAGSAGYKLSDGCPSPQIIEFLDANIVPPAEEEDDRGVSVIPEVRRAKAGKTSKAVRFMVSASNNSTTNLPVEVTFSAEPAGAVSFPRSKISMTVPGKKNTKQKAKTLRKPFTVLVPPSASGDVTISASIGESSDTSTLKIRAAKK